MLHGKVLTTDYPVLTLQFGTSTDHSWRLRASIPATSTPRITYFVDTQHTRSKVNKIYVVLPFFLLQSYAYAYKFEYLLSKLTHFIQMEASENYYLSLVL